MAAIHIAIGTLGALSGGSTTNYRSSPAFTDRTAVGTLDLPSLGIGTIAWLGKTEEDKTRIAGVAAAAKARGLDFVDTAERYGASPLSLIPAALAGLGLPLDKSYLGGDCESNLATWGRGSTVATKFTPTPWRRSASDVVEAARASCERLGVDQIELYQLHMPDVIQVQKLTAHPSPTEPPITPFLIHTTHPSQPLPTALQSVRRGRPQGLGLLGRAHRVLQAGPGQERGRLQLRRHHARACTGAPRAERRAPRLEPDRA